VTNPSIKENAIVSERDVVLQGAGHRDALADLIDHHLRTAKGGVPSLLCVKGGPGVGKSRLLLEFYRGLAATQASPRYWPEPDERWNGSPPDVRPGSAAMPFF
jgi:hypothetical protein